MLAEPVCILIEVFYNFQSVVNQCTSKWAKLQLEVAQVSFYTDKLMQVKCSLPAKDR